MERKWNDWKWQLRNSLKIPLLPETAPVAEEFPVRVTPYYRGLMETDRIPDDPLYRQVFPDIREMEDSCGDALDPLAEEHQMPVPNLIHRYRDRAVLLTTNACAVHCRFCLRKRNWKRGRGEFRLNDQAMDTIVEYLSQHKEINEVLVSGGDPLLLENLQLKKIILRISQIENISIIRLGTRVPAVLPMRIDDELADMLAEIPGLWVATHFNHPREVTEEAVSACSKLLKRGIPILNQTVLLKNINDDAEILCRLFHSLAVNRIKPHYLFHIDPVAGNAHFATGIEKGLKIMREFRNSLSSLETPVFAIDLPGGGGKVPLMPEYRQKDGFEALDGTVIPYLISPSCSDSQAAPEKSL